MTADPHPIIKPLRKPDWIRSKIPAAGNLVQKFQDRLQAPLATVCQEANCPNQGECWNSGTATFMLMGDTCTRACRFCAVKTAKNPSALDEKEPDNLVTSLKNLKLKYVVLTTVDRDDLEDQGAGHIGNCIEAVRSRLPEIIVEILIPDFQGEEPSIQRIMQSGPHVIGHNLECTRSLTRKVRDPRAGYDQSLTVLEKIKSLSSGIYTKSSLMLGFGETEAEVLEAMQDLRAVKTDFLTLGQYLQPNSNKLPVNEFIPPEKFDWFREKGLEMGFGYVASGPLVRSSYQAAEHFIAARMEQDRKNRAD
ncbi:MAG: lipoyl synthase [Deltaproteobacteria bacterium]|nr:lipoyl synthase [Deltaproteobacteria bacterium]